MKEKAGYLARENMRTHGSCSQSVLENGEREVDCSEVTRQAAMKVMEILLDEGFVH